jgi:hypothetical protein
MSTSTQLWIVDWDLPYDQPAARVQFHRALKRLCRETGSAETRSTLSVLKTDNPTLAKCVYRLALGFGTANLYQVVEVLHKPIEIRPTDGFIRTQILWNEWTEWRSQL